MVLDSPGGETRLLNSGSSVARIPAHHQSFDAFLVVTHNTAKSQHHHRRALSRFQPALILPSSCFHQRLLRSRAYGARAHGGASATKPQAKQTQQRDVQGPGRCQRKWQCPDEWSRCAERRRLGRPGGYASSCSREEDSAKARAQGGHRHIPCA